MPPACRPNTTEFKGVSYLSRHGPIVQAVRIVQLTILKVIFGKLTKIWLFQVAKFYSRLYRKGRKLAKFIKSKELFTALSTDVAN